jgi:hypothetical protein
MGGSRVLIFIVSITGKKSEGIIRLHVLDYIPNELTRIGREFFKQVLGLLRVVSGKWGERSRNTLA